MAWTGSAVFTQWVNNPMFKNGTAPTGYTSLPADTVKCALFGTTASMTPDKNAVVGQTGYNSASSQWVVANEKTGASEWVAGGRTLLSDAITAGAGFVMYDAADLTGVASLTMSGIAGCLIYNDTISGGTVADQGVCYNWFGADQSVTAGTFSVAFHAEGICRFIN